MRVFHSYEPLPSETTCSVFLMGPTPRGHAGAVPSWRPEALRILETLGFQGDVFVPEPRDGVWPSDPAVQIGWEDAALNQTDRILVWLPRRMDTLPGLTTNDEWGYWKGRDPARLILGTPNEAEHVRYQHYYAKSLHIPICSTLEETCRVAAGDPGVLRRDGECQVPLHIWRTAAFQAWYAAQSQAGNVLCGAKVEWVFRVGRQIVFYWALHVDVFVTAENRHKTNEAIMGRPDLAAVVLYRRGKELLDTEIVLVREYRSPARTPDGYIWELPSGSSFKPNQAMEITAAHEIEEELGLKIDPQSLRRHEARQLAGTLSVHQAQVFSVELTENQIADLRVQEASHMTHGVIEHSEITSIRVRTVREILAEGFADWSTLGMILGVLAK